MDHQLAEKLNRDFSMIIFLCRCVLVVATWFTALCPVRADIALANFCDDTNQVKISLRLPTGEITSLGAYRSGQVTGFLGLTGRSDFSFTHPDLGTNSITLEATNSPHFLVFSKIGITNTPTKGSLPTLLLQKWPIGTGQTRGYQAMNLCQHPVTFLVNQEKKLKCPPSLEKPEIIEISSAKSVTIAREDGSDATGLNPEEIGPYLIIFFPTADKNKFAWTAQPLPTP